MIGFTAAFAKSLSIIFSESMHPVFKDVFSRILRSITWKDDNVDFTLYRSDNIAKEEFEKVLVENGFVCTVEYEDDYSYIYTISWK